MFFLDNRVPFLPRKNWFLSSKNRKCSKVTSSGQTDNYRTKYHKISFESDRTYLICWLHIWFSIQFCRCSTFVAGKSRFRSRIVPNVVKHRAFASSLTFTFSFIFSINETAVSISAESYKSCINFLSEPKNIFKANTNLKNE